MKRLEIYGDSILKGVVWSAEQHKYKLCRDNSFRGLEQTGMEVKNNSRMGATIETGIALMEKRLADCDSNTIVLLEYGGNDCDYIWSDISDNPSGSFEPRTPIKRFSELYEKAIAFARSKGAQVAISSLIPLDSEKYMGWISKNLNYKNILHWLGDVSMLSRWQEYYSHVVEQIAEKNDCRLIDLRRDFLLDHGFKQLLCDDGIHPTERGHNLINSRLASLAVL